MFPTLKVFVSGLNNDLDYNIQLEIKSVDSKRYRYVYPRLDRLLLLSFHVLFYPTNHFGSYSSEWIVSGYGDPHLTSVTQLHPDSPAPGRVWNSQKMITFDR